jgi:hypothetical protein
MQGENSEENFSNFQTITNNETIIRDEKAERHTVQSNGNILSLPQPISQMNTSDSFGQDKDKDKTTKFTFKDISFQKNNKRYQALFRLPEQETLKHSTVFRIDIILKTLTSKRIAYLH